ncbi:MAG: DUF4281 domain-containing protein [Alphaproteobacteria bacterium]|nr:DUF4281 domain-containing protein [Alphaproteobacteria bacterium]
MSADVIFAIANGLALCGWLLLLLAPGWRTGRRWIAGFALPAVFSLTYLIVFVPQLFTSRGGFGSLEALTTLLNDDPRVMLGAWLHYLAFDLLVGAWMSEEADRRGIAHAAMVPALILTFLAGPVGWLLFLVVRARYPSSIRGAP